MECWKTAQERAGLRFRVSGAGRSGRSVGGGEQMGRHGRGISFAHCRGRRGALRSVPRSGRTRVEIFQGLEERPRKSSKVWRNRARIGLSRCESDLLSAPRWAISQRYAEWNECTNSGDCRLGRRPVRGAGARGVGGPRRVRRDRQRPRHHGRRHHADLGAGQRPTTAATS